MPADSDVVELHGKLAALVSESEVLLGEMKPVVRDSLVNLDSGMLKTLEQFTTSGSEQSCGKFVEWLNTRGQVEVMLMWVQSMLKVTQYNTMEGGPA